PKARARIRRHPDPKKNRFLSGYVRVANVSGAAALAGIDRGTHYDWLNNDPDYKKAFEYAKDDAADALEQELRRRAIEGTPRPVYQGGRRVGFITEHSDSLGMFLLKGARPEKYRDRFEV